MQIIWYSMNTIKVKRNKINAAESANANLYTRFGIVVF